MSGQVFGAGVGLVTARMITYKSLFLVTTGPRSSLSTAAKNAAVAVAVGAGYWACDSLAASTAATARSDDLRHRGMVAKTAPDSSSARNWYT